MIVFILLAVAILLVVIRNPPLEKILGGSNFPDIDKIQKEIHEYSGINKDLYMSYITKIDNAKEFVSDPDISAQYLYGALEDLRNVTLSLPGGDSDIPEKINDYAGKLGKLFEHYIMENALRKGIRFTPAYLNEKFINISEYES